MQKQWLTPIEISEMLKLSYEKTLDFIKYSGVSFAKIGRQYRVSETALDAYLSKHPHIHI